MSVCFSPWSRNAFSERSENCETHDRSRGRGDDGERDSEPPADSDKRLRHDSIVGFPACRKGIRFIARLGGCRCSSASDVEVETPHPRAAVKGLAERLDGLRLDGVEAVGKNLLFRFEGGLVLRSHLRMKGRWRLEQRGSGARGEAVARVAGLRARGRALERPRARARRGAAERRGSVRTSSASRRTSKTMLARLRAGRRSARSETRCSTSVSWRGSATSGAPKRSGRRRSRRGDGSREVADDELRARARGGAPR